MNHCPICKNSHIQLKFKLTFNIFHCKNCGFQFCPDATFDKTFNSNLDEESREKALRQLRKDNFQKIIQSIKKHANTKLKGLEVGSGYGWFLESCIDNNIECEGIEPETRFNERYKNKELNVINGFYPTEISQNNKYEFIVFNDVIEHIPDIGKIMDANYTLLNTNGLLILNIPIQEGLVYFFSKFAYYLGIKSLLNRMWQFNFHSPHLSYFTKKNIIDFLEANNFYLEESYKLKTINLSEIYDRIKQDKKQNFITRFVTYTGVLFLYPLFQIFPDTFCFVLKKKHIMNS